MTSLFRKQLRSLILLVALLVPHTFLFAQVEQVLSVTPPLFQLSVNPGDVWQSAIKVVNSNAYDLTVYTELVDFAPYGEAGQGRFIPLNQDDDVRATLGEWIEMSSGPHTISPEQSLEIPFFVDVPKDAPPGGHFAAILISTQPPERAEGATAVLTSQTVTSLFFVRIAGDVIEEGTIREFSMVDSFVERPEAEFSLRFENKGNVHLQPRGDIVITNMWGTERGIIPVNHQTHFGNVLPQSIRDFRFAWSGESSLTDIGRYRAVATLAYGEDGVKSVSATTYFWVIPLKATAVTLGVLIMFILFITWMIRLYIRRMLAMAGVDVDTMEHVGTAHTVHEESDVRLASYRTVSGPLRSGARDLKERLSGVSEFIDIIKTIGVFVLTYKFFFITLVVLIAGFVGAVLFVSDASQADRAYEVRIKEVDGERVVTDEEIEALREEGE